jgi:hypothetical protein
MSSEKPERNNDDKEIFQGIDPSRLSIRMSLKNSFLFPCSTCGSVMIRLPFEVVDQYGNPICRECCQKINHSLWMLLDFYYREMGHYTFNLMSSGGNQYHGSWGMRKVEGKPPQYVLDFMEGMLEIADRLEIEQFFFNNLSGDKFEGMAAFKLTRRELQEHVERTTKEYMDENSEAGQEIKYYLIFNTKKSMTAQMTAINMTNIFNAIQNDNNQENKAPNIN